MTHLVFSPSIISASSNGLWIAVTATADPGQEIHTCGVTGTDEYEEIRLFTVNAATGFEPLSILWGSTDVGSRFPNSDVAPSTVAGPIAPHGINPISATTSIIRVWTTGTATTGSIRIIGSVNRATDAG